MFNVGDRVKLVTVGTYRDCGLKEGSIGIIREIEERDSNSKSLLFLDWEHPLSSDPGGMYAHRFVLFKKGVVLTKDELINKKIKELDLKFKNRLRDVNFRH